MHELGLDRRLRHRNGHGNSTGGSRTDSSGPSPASRQVSRHGRPGLHQSCPERRPTLLTVSQASQPLPQPTGLFEGSVMTEPRAAHTGEWTFLTNHTHVL